MKKLITFLKLFVVLFFLSGSLFAQVTQQWVKFYSNNEGGDIATKIALDAAGNVYVTGYSYDSISGNDFATIKYNTSGVQQWVQRYTGPGKREDMAEFISVDAAGNVYVCGSSKGNNNVSDYALIKYNTNGVQQWVHRYDGKLYWPEIKVDNTGNLYLLGTIIVPVPNSSDDSAGAYTTIKYNSIGSVVWVRNYFYYDTSGYGLPSNIAKTLAIDNSGNVYVTGESIGLNYSRECATIKYNSFGDSIWVRRTSMANILINPVAIAVNNSGYVFVTGHGYTPSNLNLDFVTIKYNSSGGQQWVQRYNGPGDSSDTPTSIAVDLNNVYVTGISIGSTSGMDYATVKYDFSGVQQWARTYNGTGNGMDYSKSIKLDTSGNSYITGFSSINGYYSEIATFKYDYFGNQKWMVKYNGILNIAVGNDLTLNSSGNVFVTGTADGKYVTIKYSQSIGIKNISSEIPEKFSLSQNYPNPFNPTTNIRYAIPKSGLIKLVVFDVLGREVETLVNRTQQAGTYEATFDGSNYPSGVYFYKISTNEFTGIKKLLLLK